MMILKQKWFKKLQKLNKESSEKTHSNRAAHQGSVVLGIVIEFNSLDNKY